MASRQGPGPDGSEGAASHGRSSPGTLHLALLAQMTHTTKRGGGEQTSISELSFIQYSVAESICPTPGRAHYQGRKWRQAEATVWVIYASFRVGQEGSVGFIVLGSTDSLRRARSVSRGFPGAYCPGVRWSSSGVPSLWLRPGMLNDKSYNFTHTRRTGKELQIGEMSWGLFCVAFRRTCFLS